MRKIRSSRSKWDILLEALAFLSKEDNAPRTKVKDMMGGTPQDAVKYLNLLEARNCIQIVKPKEGVGVLCNITPKGRELKEKLQGIYNLCGGGKRPEW